MCLYNNIHCSKKYKNTGSNRSSRRLTISGAVLNISCDNRQVKNVRSYQLLTYLSTLEFRMY